MLGRRTSALRFALTVLASILLLLPIGCADREDLEEAQRQESPGYGTEANAALEKPEAAIMPAGRSSLDTRNRAYRPIGSAMHQASQELLRPDTT